MSKIEFVLNGQLHCVEAPSPTQTVLQWLRESAGLCGTKEGCAEGDCGACTVVLGTLEQGEFRTQTINACIRFMCTLHGKAIFTVEYLKQSTGNLHPVQQSLVDHHASQCGFCTPGFVMSLWQLYLVATGESGAQSGEYSIDRAELTRNLTGNLCRCTGYRPILEAGSAMLDYPRHAASFDETIRLLENINHIDSLVISDRQSHLRVPADEETLSRLLSQYPETTILSGCTDVGLWVTKQFRPLPSLVYIGDITSLKFVERNDQSLSIGAAVSLQSAYEAICHEYPELVELWERFASVPVRNAGTLIGNIANGSPIGDSMPWLLAWDASVELVSTRVTRTLPLDQLYTGYMKQSREPDEWIRRVVIPRRKPYSHYRCYKVSKRYDSDISAVCLAVRMTIKDNQIEHCQLAVGGMAAIPLRTLETEGVLNGSVWNDDTLAKARQSLENELKPLSDLRASADYRLSVIANLLTRFYLETSAGQSFQPVLKNSAVSVFAVSQDSSAQ